MFEITLVWSSEVELGSVEEPLRKSAGGCRAGREIPAIGIAGILSRPCKESFWPSVAVAVLL